MNWQTIVERVNPFVVKIETPDGHGTGFVCAMNADRSLVGIATAWHVISHAASWGEPIRIKDAAGQVAFFGGYDYTVWPSGLTDSAMVLVDAARLGFVFPEDLLPLLPTSSSLAIGAEVGWLGYPAIESWTCCFFSGNISAHVQYSGGHLIDGVVIHGVSGAPVFHNTPTSGVQIVGVITEYRANRRGADSLPGLSYARDVSHFHESIQKLRDLDQARREAPQVPPPQDAV